MYLIKITREWYKGKLIKGKPSHTKDEESGVILHLYTDYYEQPLVAKILKHIGRAWLRHWKVLLPIAVAIILAFVTIATNAT